MPTKLPRLQVITTPKDHAIIENLAERDERSVSKFCRLFIRDAIKYRRFIEQAKELERKGMKPRAVVA